MTTITIEFEKQTPFSEINQALKELEDVGYSFILDGYRSFKGIKTRPPELPRPLEPGEPIEPVEVTKKPKKKSKRKASMTPHAIYQRKLKALKVIKKQNRSK